MTTGVTRRAPLMLSVSGCRGIVGASLTPETICRYALAAAGGMRAGGAGPMKVIVARDGRRGGEVVAAIATGALRAAGCSVIDLGVATTPTAGVMVRRYNAAGGLVATASHNPGEWNGLKPITRDGCAPAPADAARIVEAFHAGGATLAPADALGGLDADDTAAHAHVAAVLEALSRIISIDAIKARRFRVALDSVNASGATGGRLLLEALGCDLVHLNAETSGVFPHTPEPTAENLAGLCAQVRDAKAAVGFAQDPDADRLAILDAQGGYIGEEYTLALAAWAMLGAPNAPKNAAIAANLSTSRMLDDVVARFGGRVVRTPVGEANVVEGMLREGCPLGGEGNGGVIWPEVVLIRDSLGAMALTLALAAREGKTLSELAGAIPAYAIVKRKAPIAEGLAERAFGALRTRFAGERFDDQDGLRVDIESRSAWLHVRPSNTEPILRLIAEAPTQADAEALLDEAAGAIEGA
ncbi:MAG: phosphoglucosamine mutase [Phycisphaerales bacterium]